MRRHELPHSSIPTSHPETNSRTAKPAFVLVLVLVHGAWHGAWCYAKVIPHLVKAGYLAVAVDLLGHGLDTKFPRSYHTQPLDMGLFATEPSPLSGITLDDYVMKIADAIDGVIAAGSGPVILVGHSMGGLSITATAQSMPEKIAKLIYLAAFLPASGVPIRAYIESPEFQSSKLGPAIIGNPAATRVLILGPVMIATRPF